MQILLNCLAITYALIHLTSNSPPHSSDSNMMTDPDIKAALARIG
ncbi:MAG: hypothetical protein WCS87_17525 [Methylococcaceae bacterium]